MRVFNLGGKEEESIALLEVVAVSAHCEATSLPRYF